MQIRTPRNNSLRADQVDAQQQARRTIELYEQLLDRAREVAHDAKQRLQRCLDDSDHDEEERLPSGS